jgi:hypothetical protein
LGEHHTGTCDSTLDGASRTSQDLCHLVITEAEDSDQDECLTKGFGKFLEKECTDDVSSEITDISDRR